MIRSLTSLYPHLLTYGTESVYPYSQRYDVDSVMNRANPRISHDSSAVATVSSTDHTYQPANWNTTLIRKYYPREWRFSVVSLQTSCVSTNDPIIPL